MKRDSVKSSNIKDIGYDKEKKLLEVGFNNGTVYQYHPVTEGAYKDLVSAESIGKHFHSHIKSNNLLDVKQIS